MSRTSPGWLSLLLGCLLLLTGCAIDPEHFDGLNPVPGAARKDVAYSEMRALRIAADRAEAIAGHDGIIWRSCSGAAAAAAGLQCGSLTAGASTTSTDPVVVRRPVVDAVARTGVALMVIGPDAPIDDLASAVLGEPSTPLVRTFDLVAVSARSVADLETVRVALGEQTWSLIGTGTTAGIVADYAVTHPDRTRAAVLDRPTPATTTGPVMSTIDTTGDPMTLTAAGPAAAQIRVAARSCSPGPATLPPGGSDGLMAAPTTCVIPPVLLVAPAAGAVGKTAAGSTDDAWGGLLLTVSSDAATDTCVDAAIGDFLLTLGVPTSGSCT
ncbi:hypothetical protein JL107_02740 [Nakamurella flavida]|uniref:Uncharacterized protein n=1 Tax=Nakamurella flavida TaxID=363630 RepID=A0A938YLA8_9ACTN|nr:hypothetical protein [Nakamurella flavida]MBM9475354.1 hypothetical protein [Nakamurella flavida]MDP9776932.1 pimeloyl-ACP methyl ester carboxylesterase [Nakamurella flavida]